LSYKELKKEYIFETKAEVILKQNY
jgi:hypothetical protein